MKERRDSEDLKLAYLLPWQAGKCPRNACWSQGWDNRVSGEKQREREATEMVCYRGRVRRGDWMGDKKIEVRSAVTLPASLASLACDFPGHDWIS